MTGPLGKSEFFFPRISMTVAKEFENKFGQVAEKLSDLIFLFVWMSESNGI